MRNAPRLSIHPCVGLRAVAGNHPKHDGIAAIPRVSSNRSLLAIPQADVETLKAAVEKHPVLQWDPRMADFDGWIGTAMKDNANDNITQVHFCTKMGGIVAWLPAEVLQDQLGQRGLSPPGSSSVLIKNLDPSIDSKNLFDTFSIFGNIVSCKVVTDRTTGKSRGYGFVHFKTQEAANLTIAKVNGNGNVIAGRQVSVEAL